MAAAYSIDPPRRRYYPRLMKLIGPHPVAPARRRCDTPAATFNPAAGRAAGRLCFTMLLAALLLAAGRPAEAAAEGRSILGVSVYGDYRIDRALLLRTFGLGAGDTYTRAGVAAALGRVERLEGVRHATHRVVRDSGTEGVHLLLIISEEPTRSVVPVIRRNFADRIAVGLTLRETNLRGLSEHLYASGLFGGATILRAGWIKPTLTAAPPLGLEIRAGYSRYRWPYPSFSDEILDDRLERFEAGVTARLRLGAGFSLFVTPGLEIFAAGDPMLEAPGGGAPAAQAPSGTLPTLEAGIDLARIDRLFYPRSGVLLKAALKSWGIARSEAPFELTRLTARGTAFVDLRRALFSLHADGVFSRGEVPVYLYEHLGGVATIRGHEFGAFYGHSSLLLRGDLRIPINFSDLPDLGNPIILVALDLFADTGAAWNDAGLPAADLFHSGLGLGLSFIPHQNWLLRFGHAWPMDPEGRWFFDIGTMF